MNDPKSSTQPQTQTRTAPAEVSPPTDFERLLQKKEMAFVPFGGQDKIKLTPKIVADLIAVPTASGKTCSERDALRFMMMCQAKRLNPFEGDAFLIGYDGRNGPQFSLITAHQAFLKRAEVHPEFDGMSSGVIVLEEDSGKMFDREGDFHLPDEKVVGGWATVHFKNRKIPTTRRIRLERFNNGFAQWKVDPAGMICKCAEADALRSSFPTMVGGLYLREELEFMPDAPAAGQFSKPLFESPLTKGSATAAAAGLDTKPETEPVPESQPNTPKFEQSDDGDLGPVSNAPASAPAPATKAVSPEGHAYNPLRALRGLIKMSKHKEGELMDFWSGTGATDGSATSLEEVAMSSPELIKSTAEQWKEIDARITELKKKEAR